MNMAAPAMQNYPTGVRFHPTDLELVAYFLHDKAEVEKTGWYSDIIHECNDFYGDKEPWVIWDAYKSSTHDEGEPLYFYTKRIRQNNNGKRFARKVGTGTWSGQYSKEVLTAEDGTKIGTMRNFRYEKGCDNDQNGAWLMHEYESEFYQNGGNDYVICVLRKKSRKTPKDETTKKNGVKLGKRSKSDDVVAETEEDQNDEPTKRLKEEEISEVGKEESSNEQGCSSCTQLQEQWYHQDQGTSSYYYPAENNYFPEIFDADYDDGATIEQLLGPITDEYYKSISFQDQLYRGGDDNSNDIGNYSNDGFSQLLNDQPNVDYLANI